MVNVFQQKRCYYDTRTYILYLYLYIYFSVLFSRPNLKLSCLSWNRCFLHLAVLHFFMNTEAEAGKCSNITKHISYFYLKYLYRNANVQQKLAGRIRDVHYHPRLTKKCELSSKENPKRLEFMDKTMQGVHTGVFKAAEFKNDLFILCSNHSFTVF